MPVWDAPLDPAEYKSYVAQFQPVIGTDTITSIVATLDSAGTAAGVVIDVTTNPPQAINDPLDSTSLLSAVELYFHIPVTGNQSNTGFDNAGTAYNVTVRVTTTTTGSVYEEDWILTVKNSGAPRVTWSFNPALTTDRDWVRFEIDDTDQADQLVMDQTIDALLTKEGSVLGAATRVAQHLHAKFSREVTVSAEGASVKLSDLSEKYRKLSLDLKRRSADSSIPAPVVAGISKTENAAVRADSDRAVSGLRPGLHDNPEACW